MDPQYLLEAGKIKMQTLQMKLDYERVENEKQRVENEKQRQHEIELKHLELEGITTKKHQPSSPDLLKYVKLIPSFPDADPEAFFWEFESAARHYNIPVEEWVWLIKPKFAEKALTVCNNTENNTEYNAVKRAILSSYSISIEGYRQKFRNLGKLQHQTFAEFASDKLRGLKAWLKSAYVDTFDRAINLIALEEFL